MNAKATDTLRMTEREREEYLLAVRRGASPMAACATVGVSLDAVALAEQTDVEFAAALEQVGALLSQNAAAALYRQGMEGSVPALTFLLKNQPPPEWTRRDAASLSDNELDSLSDEALLRLLERTEGMAEKLARGERREASDERRVTRGE